MLIRFIQIATLPIALCLAAWLAVLLYRRCVNKQFRFSSATSQRDLAVVKLIQNYWLAHNVTLPLVLRVGNS
jgi:hypothetical protein